MGHNEDWSEYTQPEVVELAGKWKHGWIPLDATAVSSKMKGNTGGKKWWGGGKSSPGVLKKGTKSRREGLQGTVTSEVRHKGKAPEPGSGLIHGAENGKRITAKITPSEAAERGLSRKSGSMLTTKEVPSAGFQKRGSSKESYQRGKLPSMTKTPTADGKPIDVTQKRLTGSGQAVRTLGSQADTLAQNYIKMHGADGARKKLAALKKTKTRDARKKELIAALQKALSGKSLTPDRKPASRVLKVTQVPGAKAGIRQDTFHVTNPDRAKAVKEKGFHGKPRTMEEGFGGDYFGAGTYVSTDKAHSDKYLRGVRMFMMGDEVQIKTQTKLKNPFKITATHQDMSPSAVISEAMVKKGLAKPGERLSGPEITRRLKAAGYDGVDLKQSKYTDDLAGSQQVVFDPKNVRVRPDLKPEKVIRLKTQGSSSKNTYLRGKMTPMANPKIPSTSNVSTALKKAGFEKSTSTKVRRDHRGRQVGSVSRTAGVTVRKGIQDGEVQISLISRHQGSSRGLSDVDRQRRLAEQTRLTQALIESGFSVTHDAQSGWFTVRPGKAQ